MHFLHIKFLKKKLKSHWKSIQAIKELVNAHLNMNVKRKPSEITTEENKWRNVVKKSWRAGKKKKKQKSIILILSLLALDFLIALVASDLLEMWPPSLGLEDTPLFWVSSLPIPSQFPGVLFSKTPQSNVLIWWMPVLPTRPSTLQQQKTHLFELFLSYVSLAQTLVHSMFSRNMCWVTNIMWPQKSSF